MLNFSEDNETDPRNQGRHFQIKYNILENKYFIRDLGNGLGSFTKIKDFFVLRSDSLFNIGDSFVVFYIGDNREMVNEDDVNKNINSNSNENNLNEDRNTCVTTTSLLLTLKIYSGKDTYDLM